MKTRIAPTLGPAPPRHEGPAMPPPRRVRHVRTLWWWLLLLGAGLAGAYRGADGPGEATAPATEAAATERDSFVAVVFGRVGSPASGAMDPQVLRAQLTRLKESGAHVVRLREALDFLAGRAALPSRPVLLVFDEARRETVETVEPVLAELGLPATTFVNVTGMEQGNVDLVSRRKLGQMARSGLWDFGVGACREADGDIQFSGPEFRRRASAIEKWAGAPVLAISCLRGWDSPALAERQWIDAVRAAALPLGFIYREPGANRRQDLPWTLRLVRIGADDSRPDAVVQRVIAYTPRHERYADDFRGPSLANAWIATGGHARVKPDGLNLLTAAGSAGELTLGGTEQWQDTRTHVRLAGPPAGQFWIYARRNGPLPFLRFGVTEGRVVLQRSDESGQTRQLAAVDAPGGVIDLKLQVIGGRALAWLNDQALTERPAEVPDGLDQGSVTLAVWDDAVDSLSVVRDFEAEPLPRRIALLDTSPTDAGFEQLRAQAGSLWALSPRQYRWRGGQGASLAGPDLALSIFAHHHHIELLPAVQLDAFPDAAQWPHLRARLLEWAGASDCAGLNLVVERVRPEDVPRIEELRRALAMVDRELVVTARRRADLAAAPDLLWSSGSGAGGLQYASAPPRRPAG